MKKWIKKLLKRLGYKPKMREFINIKYHKTMAGWGYPQ